jgi:hypothetical protein
MSDCKPIYSLKSPYSGVSIDSSTGVVTVQSNAVSGTVKIQASYGNLTPTTATLTLSNPNILCFTDEEYCIDAYDGIDFPVYICAYVEDGQGVEVTAPELVSLVYTADSGASNTTGIFTKEELEISPGEETHVTATALLSDGTELNEAVLVYAPYIHPRR